MALALILLVTIAGIVFISLVQGVWVALYSQTI